MNKIAQTNPPDAALPKGVASLETTLEHCCDTVRHCLEFARSPALKQDYDAQDMAFNRAVAFLEASAKVGMALAKMRGEHTSNIRIHRTQTTEQEVRVEFPAPVRREPDPQSKPLDPVTETRINQIYDDWLQARAAKQGDVQNHFGDEQDEQDEQDEEEGGTPSNFGGSNASGS